MIEIFSSPVSTVSNRSITLETLNLSSRLTLSNVANIRIRIQIISLDVGSELRVTYTINSNSTPMASTTKIFTMAGLHIIGFRREDWNSNTTLRVEAQVIGRIRLSVNVIAYLIGEDVIE